MTEAIAHGSLPILASRSAKQQRLQKKLHLRRSKTSVGNYYNFGKQQGGGTSGDEATSPTGAVSLNGQFEGFVDSSLISFYDVWPANNNRRKKGIDHKARSKPPFLPTDSTKTIHYQQLTSGAAASERAHKEDFAASMTTATSGGAEPKLLVEIQTMIATKLAALGTEARTVTLDEDNDAPLEVLLSSRATGFDKTLTSDDVSPSGLGRAQSPAVSTANIDIQLEEDSAEETQPFNNTMQTTLTQQTDVTEVSFTSLSGASPARRSQSPTLPPSSPSPSTSQPQSLRAPQSKQTQRSTVTTRTKGSSTAVSVSRTPAFERNLKFYRQRLDVFKEAAGLFGSAFKSYQPLLQSILKEYDVYVEAHEREMRRVLNWIEKLENGIGALQKQNEQLLHKNNQANQGMKKTVADYKKQVTHLTKQLDDSKETLKELQRSIGMTVEEERESRNNNTVLLKVIRNLEIDKEVLHDKIVEKEKEKEDLYRSLAMEQDKTAEVRALVSNLNNVKLAAEAQVKACEREIRNLHRQYDDDLASTKKLRAEVTAGKMKIQTTNNQLYDTAEKLNKANEALANYKRMGMTPRPRWEDYPNARYADSSCGAVARLSTMVTDAEHRAKEAEEQYKEMQEYLGLCEDRNVFQLTELDNMPKFFASLGNAYQIPPFLRTGANQKIRNRKLGIKETLNNCAEFWKVRDKQWKQQTAELDSTNFIDALGDWLRAKYGTKNVVLEYGYCMYHVLDQAKGTVAYARQFFNAMMHPSQFPEAAFVDLQRIIDTVKASFEGGDIDLAAGKKEKKKSGELPKSEVIAILNQCLHWKTDARFAQLFEAMKESFTSFCPPSFAASKAKQLSVDRAYLSTPTSGSVNGGGRPISPATPNTQQTGFPSRSTTGIVRKKFDSLKYSELFEKNQLGIEHPFVLLLRSQYEEEREEYLMGLQDAVLGAARKIFQDEKERKQRELQKLREEEEERIKAAKRLKRELEREAIERGEVPGTPSSNRTIGDKAFIEEDINTTITDDEHDRRTSSVTEHSQTFKRRKESEATTVPEKDESDSDTEVDPESCIVTPAFVAPIVRQFDRGLDWGDVAALLCRGFVMKPEDLLPTERAKEKRNVGFAEGDSSDGEETKIPEELPKGKKEDKPKSHKPRKDKGENTKVESFVQFDDQNPPPPIAASVTVSLETFIKRLRASCVRRVVNKEETGYTPKGLAGEVQVKGVPPTYLYSSTAL